MEKWQKEIDELLSPHGVAFSADAVVQNFRQEIRSYINSTPFPCFSAILLYDGAGCLWFRISSIVIPTVCALIFKWEYRVLASFLFIVSSVVWIPGFWMWSYYLTSREERIRQMEMLFYKKIQE